MKILFFICSVVYLVSAVAEVSCSDFFSPYSQSRLINLISLQQPEKLSFIKNQPVAMLVIGKEGAASLPSEIVDALGKLDNVQYTADYMKNVLQPGNYILIQSARGGLEFYPATRTTIESSYTFLENRQNSFKDLSLYRDIEGSLGSSFAQSIQIALKTDPVEMIRLSDLGVDIQAVFAIIGPYGEQTKSNGFDGYLAVHKKTGQFYLIQADEQGLPLGYVKSK